MNIYHLNEHMRKLILCFAAVPVLLAMFPAAASNAQDAAATAKRQDEIRLVEDLLNSYLETYDLPWMIDDRIHGIELAEWGVVFFVPVNLNPRRIIAGDFDLARPSASTGFTPVDEDSLVGRLQDDLVNFLCNYTHTLTELRPQDRIMIVIDEGPSAGFDGLMVYFSKAKNRLMSAMDSGGEKEIARPRFSLCATKESLDDYRSRKISRDELREKIEISKQFGDLEKSNELFYRSMKTMETAFRSRLTGSPEPLFQDVRVQSIYLPQYGVIFVVESRGFPMSFNWGNLDSSLIIAGKKAMESSQRILGQIQTQLRNDPVIGPYMWYAPKDSAEAKKSGEGPGNAPNPASMPQPPQAPQFPGMLFGQKVDMKERIEELKTNLITTTAQFGHTLDILRDEDRVTIVSLVKESFPGMQEGSKIQIVARMGDIRRFFRGETDLEGFRAKAVVKEN